MRNDRAGIEIAPPRPEPAAGDPSRAAQALARHAIDASLFYRCCRAICRVFFTTYFDLQVYGREHVPAEGGVLLVANHESYLDPVLVPVLLRRPVSYFAKSELFAHPIFEKLIRTLHAFPVRQGKGDVGAVKEAVSRLKEGHALAIFPEGSRSEDGRLGPIEPGAALIVRRAGVPVVPVAIDGSYQAWPRRDKGFHRYPLRVMYGPPMNVEHLKAAQIVQTIDQTLRTLLTELRSRPHPSFVRRGVTPPAPVRP